MVTKQQEEKYLERKKRVKAFFESPKLKGVRRELTKGDDFFDALFVS